MKNILLPADQPYFKANLHCHTNISDGKKTPEQVKADYKAHGYSAVAFTDHDKYICHNDLSDPDFIALNGFEMEYYKEGQTWEGITTHLCFVAETPDNKGLGFSDPSVDTFEPKLGPGEKPLTKGGGLYTVLPPYRNFSVEYINEEIEAGKKLGFFVSYNHPSWSLENYTRYTNISGFDVMEIGNYDCLNDGYDDDNGRVYNDILNNSSDAAQLCGCTATDDNHNEYPDGDVRSDSYGCWVMISAPKLSYQDLTESLKKHRFYSAACVNPGFTEAPAIKALWTENGTVHIETSPAKNILLIKDRRSFARACNSSGGTIESADFNVGPCRWFRLVVISENGNKAYTNAYKSDVLK